MSYKVIAKAIIENKELILTNDTIFAKREEAQDFIDSLFASGYRLRYSGGMVPDLHQILIKGGGLFSYPATQDAPNGKLRKLFEVFPMSFIYEQAGGEAIDGARRILDLACDSLHQSTPCFLGSKEEINALKQAYKGER